MFSGLVHYQGHVTWAAAQKTNASRCCTRCRIAIPDTANAALTTWVAPVAGPKGEAPCGREPRGEMPTSVSSGRLPPLVTRWASSCAPERAQSLTL